MTYEFPDDAKFYSTEIVPGTTDQSVMAGTLMHSTSGGNNRPHFLRLDNQGNITASVEYIDNNYDDERAVDIAVTTDNGTNRYYITCLSRQANHDYIKVLCVDDNGSIISQKIFGSTVGGGGIPQQLYPTHSAIRDDGNSKRLYICGYTTQNTSTTYPADPDRNDDKWAFISFVDIDPNSGGYMSTVQITGRDWGKTLDFNGFDLDIALRVVIVNNQDQDVFITGSVDANTWGPIPYTINNPNVSTSTMNWLVNSALSTLQDDPFIQLPNQDNVWEGPHEWGQDLLQTADGHRYIIGNWGDYIADPLQFLPPTSSPMLYRPGFFYIEPMSGGFFPSLSRKEFNIGPEMVAQGFVTSGSIATLVVTSMWPYNLCIPHPIPYDSIITVNLIKVDLSNPTTTLYSVFYINLTGTGDPNTVSNAYFNLSPNLMNIEYNPTYCAWAGDGYVFNAPKRMNNLLNLKYVNPDASFQLSDPNCRYNDSCTEDFHDQAVVQTPIGYEKNFSISEITSNSTDHSYSVPAPMPCYDQASNINYKGGSTLVKQQRKYASSSVYPNPATDYIQISLAKNLPDDAHVKITLFDVTGRQVANLYEGDARGLNNLNRLPLPQVASGLYLVNIIGNDKMLLRQKLSIRQ
jgi:hypothetical protein